MNTLFDNGGGACEPVPSSMYLQKSTLDPFSNSLQARLEKAVEAAKAQLADALRAREIFDKHPDLEELQNILQKGRL